MSSEFFSINQQDKKKNINVWIAYHATEKGVNTCIHYKKFYLQHFLEGNGDYFNILDALLDSTIMVLDWYKFKKDLVCVTIHCKNNHYYNIMNEWRHSWKKTNYKIKDEDRPFSEKLRKIDDTEVEIHKIVHVVNSQDWNTNVDKNIKEEVDKNVE